MENSGKIDDLPLPRHLKQVYDAALEFFWWQADQAGQASRGFRYDDSQRPDQPEPLAIFNYLQNLKTTFWPGGLADQPYVLTMELQECINAQNEVQRELGRQAQMKANIPGQLGMPRMEM